MRRETGFTLVEILIVITMLAILAMIVAPRVSSSSDEARESALLTNFRSAREAVQRYKMDHGERSPHVNAKSKADTTNFLARLTGKTDADGTINANGAYGPYLREWPDNPYCDSSISKSVTFGKATSSPRNDKSGWYYSTATLELYVNSAEGAESMQD